MTAEITNKFLQGEGRFLVIETEAEQRMVVAWACWTRIGTSAAAMKIRAQSDSVLKGDSDPSHERHTVWLVIFGL